MTQLPVLLSAVFLGTGNCSSKNRSWEPFPPTAASMFVKFKRICKSVVEIFWDEVFIVRNTVKMDSLDVWPLSVVNEALLTCNFTS